MPTQQLMKGLSWQQAKHRLQYPAIVEPKLDEIRCRVVVAGSSARFESFAGKPLHNLEYWANGFVRLAAQAATTEFDCGVLVNGNFNDSYRWVRSSRGIPEGLMGEHVRFILFDLPGEPYCMPYAIRRTWVRSVAEAGVGQCGLPVFSLQGVEAHNEDEILREHARHREHGYEGSMVKSAAHKYARKRTADWLKLKPEETGDGKLVGIHEAVSLAGQPLGRAGSITLECEDGSRATPHGIEHQLGYDMLRNPGAYMGCWVEFNYMERDRQGGYRHPTFKRFREDKV